VLTIWPFAPSIRNQQNRATSTRDQIILQTEFVQVLIGVVR
jgi:hypothetical protein